MWKNNQRLIPAEAIKNTDSLNVLLFHDSPCIKRFPRETPLLELRGYILFKERRILFFFFFFFLP